MTGTEGAAGDWPDGMRIVNDHLARSIRDQGMLQPPNGYGYIHLAAEVERPHPLKRNGAAKRRFLAELKTLAVRLREAGGTQLRRVDLFDAFVIPPGSKEGREVIARGSHDVHVAAFDVVVLIECADVEAARTVRALPECQAIERLLRQEASHVHGFVARNPKRIAEVDRDRPGVFLFNYFYAAGDPQVLPAVWEYTAGWWTAKANLTNSTPLQPADGERSDYSLVNHCRWDRLRDVLPHLLFRPSLKRFVLANFTANDIMAMPILYRLVS